MEKNMNPDLPQRFQQLIARYSGLRVRKENLETLGKSILDRMKILKIDEPNQYYQLLAGVDVESSDEWQEFIKLITTGESYFFRDKEQFSLLRNRILPELIRKNKERRTLRIWSAGCSSGEEPYSMATILSELLPPSDAWDILILGTDINNEAIRNAKQGGYRQWSFRMTEPDLKTRYFKQHHDEWIINETIRNRVTFQLHNLKKDVFPDTGSGIREMDLIICRNVFIYFDQDDISIVLKKFTHTLNEGGYLLTGHGELHAQDLGKLRTMPYPESMIYQKISEIKFQISDVSQVSPDFKHCAKTVAPQKKKPEKTGSIISDPLKKPQKQPDTEISVEGLFLSGSYAKAALLAENRLKDCPDNFSILYLAAKAYANLGDYEKASRHCKRAMEIDAMAHKPYLLMAHISEIIGDKERAKSLLKKAIYLNPGFIAAYIELGNLYEIEENTDRAAKQRAAAAKLLKGLAPESVVGPYKDITAGELLRSISKKVKR